MGDRDQAASPEMRSLAELRQDGYAALTRGDLDSALRILKEVLGLSHGVLAEDPDAVDKAQVDVALVHLQRQEDDLAEPGLREVLLRTTHHDVTRVVAHCLSKICSRRMEHAKAERFARLSLREAREVGESDRIHGALCLLGSVLGNQSRLAEALELYEQALALLDARAPKDSLADAYLRSSVLDAVGYTLVLLDRAEEALPHLASADSLAVAHGITDAQAEIASDLAFAALRLERFEQATVHAQRALALAEVHGPPRLRRNCYYLLGEAASRSGRQEEARAWFSRLGEFYPNVPFLADFLEAYDVSGFVNLKEFA